MSSDKRTSVIMRSTGVGDKTCNECRFKTNEQLRKEKIGLARGNCQTQGRDDFFLSSSVGRSQKGIHRSFCCEMAGKVYRIVLTLLNFDAARRTP